MVFLLGTVYNIPPSDSRNGQLPAATQGSAALMTGLRRQWRQDKLRGGAQQHQEEARETDEEKHRGCWPVSLHNVLPLSSGWSLTSHLSFPSAGIAGSCHCL